LNAQGDYPYDYALGNIAVKNLGPETGKNIKWIFDFSEKLAIRGINLVGNGNFATDRTLTITGTTNKGTIDILKKIHGVSATYHDQSKPNEITRTLPY
jgi:hypothetical protein